MNLFRREKREDTSTTPFTHWPRNIREFYPDIYERDRFLAAAHAFKREYPDVVAKFPPNAPARALMDYITENRIEPQ